MLIAGGSNCIGYKTNKGMNMRALLLGCLMLVIQGLWADDSLYVGIDPGTPPFVIQQSGAQFSGMDVDLLSSICRRINKTCIYKSMSFNDFFGALQTGDIQLAIGAITITPEREQQFIFSLPYLADTVSFVTLADSGVKAVDDLRFKKIAIDKGSILRLYLERYFYKDVTIVEIDGLSNILAALEDKAVDAAFFDTATIEFWRSNDMANLKLIGPKISIGVGYGIMGLPSMRPVMDQINAALQAMETDGDYLAIYRRYLTD
jgi:ABC-type amino acid transport substrate-binding protein